MRYVTRAAKPLYVETPLWGDEHSLVPDLQVDGAKEVDTGLISEAGEPIFRLAPPIGFGRDADW